MIILKWISIIFIVINITLLFYKIYSDLKNEKIGYYILLMLYFTVFAYLIYS